MKSIQLIVTGRLEKMALASSLQQVFSNDVQGNPVEWRDPIQLDGFTSRTVPDRSNALPEVRRLADRLLSNLTIAPNGPPPDLLVLVDDLELYNVGNETVVTNQLRLAVQALVAGDPDVAQLFRSRCSFHLLGLMVENYFLRSNGIMSSFGAPPGSFQLGTGEPPPTDVEDAQLTGGPPSWERWCANKRHAGTFQSPERHAKHFIAESLWSSSEQTTEYSETGHGAPALSTLDWATIGGGALTDAPLLAAFFADLDDFLGTRVSPLTAHQPDNRLWRPTNPDRVLRNL